MNIPITTDDDLVDADSTDNNDYEKQNEEVCETTSLEDKPYTSGYERAVTILR